MHEDEPVEVFKPKTVKKIIKVGVIGDGAVGKSTLLIAHCNGAFDPYYTPTIFDNFSSLVEIDGILTNVLLWDMAGQDDYEVLRTSCFKQVVYDMILVCYSVVSKDSFENLKFKWLTEISKYSPNTPICIVGTKTDLRKEGNPSHITTKEGEKRAKELKALHFFECSAKDMETVDGIIKWIVWYEINKDKKNNIKIEKGYIKEKKMEEKALKKLEKEQKKKENS